jgi:hypothetical protein
MASGSYFLILKDTGKVIDDFNLDKFNLFHAKDFDFWVENPDLRKYIDKLQDTLECTDNSDCDLDNIEYYSRSNKTIYSVLAKVPFLSDFTCLKDYFYMNPYSVSGEITLSDLDIYKMREALIYIKSSSLWSKSIEDFILDKNEYLKVFDELSDNFLNRFRDEEDVYELGDATLERLIMLFDSYFLIKSSNDPGKIKLVYKTW